jgi:hypothetical protein
VNSFDITYYVYNYPTFQYLDLTIPCVNDYVYNNSPFMLNEWVYVAVTYTAGIAKLYQNSNIAFTYTLNGLTSLTNINVTSQVYLFQVP